MWLYGLKMKVSAYGLWASRLLSYYSTGLIRWPSQLLYYWTDFIPCLVRISGVKGFTLLVFLTDFQEIIFSHIKWSLLSEPKVNIVLILYRVPVITISPLLCACTRFIFSIIRSIYHLLCVRFGFSSLNWILVYGFMIPSGGSL